MTQATKRIKLDKIDRRILADLQDNGRMTNVELAERSGISAPPCLRRVRALEDHEYIKSYHAVLNGPKLGYGAMAFAKVSLENQNDADLQNFLKKINEWENVRECYMVAGDSDFLLKIVAEDWDGYQRFLTTQITTMDNIASIRTMMVLKTSKFQPGVPVEVD